MATTEHTAGPWCVEEPIDGCLSIVEAGKQTFEWRFIATCPLPDGDEDQDFTDREVRANAKLIAAAPDMKKALECIQEVAGSLNGASVHVRERAVKQIAGWCAVALSLATGAS